MQEHPQPGKKRLNNLKETMIKGAPFPKPHAKAAETKAMLQPVSSTLEHFRDQDPSKEDLINLMVTALEASHSIDVLVDNVRGFKPSVQQGAELQALVLKLNVSTSRLCHFFMGRGQFLFNFVPKHHYLFHLASLGQHMSPKLAWCYQGEDLMHKVKILAQSSFRGTPTRVLGQQGDGQICGGCLPSPFKLTDLLTIAVKPCIVKRELVDRLLWNYSDNVQVEARDREPKTTCMVKCPCMSNEGYVIAAQGNLQTGDSLAAPMTQVTGSSCKAQELSIKLLKKSCFHFQGYF